MEAVIYLLPNRLPADTFLLLPSSRGGEKKDGSFPTAPSSTNIPCIIFSQLSLVSLSPSQPRVCSWIQQLKLFFSSFSTAFYLFSFFITCAPRVAECFHFSAQHMINAPQRKCRFATVSPLRFINSLSHLLTCARDRWKSG